MRIWGERSTIHSPPALFFFPVEISSRALIPLFMPGSVSPQWLSQPLFPFHLFTTDKGIQSSTKAVPYPQTMFFAGIQSMWFNFLKTPVYVLFTVVTHKYRMFLGASFYLRALNTRTLISRVWQRAECPIFFPLWPTREPALKLRCDSSLIGYNNSWWSRTTFVHLVQGRGACNQSRGTGIDRRTS